MSSEQCAAAASVAGAPRCRAPLPSK
jgi:hypothetical protein